MPIATVKVARAHADELRQIFIECSQTIGGPCANRGHARVEHVPARMKLHLRAVIVVSSPHGANHRDVIYAPADVRKPVTDLNATLAVFLIANL